MVGKPCSLARQLNGIFVQVLVYLRAKSWDVREAQVLVINPLVPPKVMYVFASFNRSLTKYLPLLLLSHGRLSIRVKRVALIKCI